MAKGNHKVALNDGMVLSPPDEDVIAPEAPKRPEFRRPRLWSPRRLSMRQVSSGDSAAVPNVQAAKRTRTADKDEEFLNRRCATSRWGANTRGDNHPVDLGDAIDHAMMTFMAWRPLCRLSMTMHVMT